MKKITLLFMISILAFSYANAQKSDVPFEVAKRYFVRNDYPEQNLHMLKITDKEKFESIFGMATVMGEGGQPTPIDFSKQFVITLINDTNDYTENILVKSLTKTDSQLYLIYDIRGQEKSSFQRRFCNIIIVDKKYMGTVSANRYSENDQEPIVGGDLDETGCKPSTGYTYSILENKCIAPWETKYVFEGDLNYPLLFSEDGTKAEVMGLSNINKKYSENLILSKSGTIWKNRDVTLSETQKDQFILKDGNKEILKGKLRK